MWIDMNHIRCNAMPAFWHLAFATVESWRSLRAGTGTDTGLKNLFKLT